MALAARRRRPATLLAVAVAFTLLVGLELLGRRPADPLARLAFDGKAYVGSWWFPRGGPLILGFDAPDGDAELRIDGQPVAHGSGQVSQRAVFAAGVHEVWLGGRGAPHARLLWHPPGRRGPLEYVSPSSLSPAAPADAVFSHPGTDRPHALVATAMLAVLALLILVLLRAFDDPRRLGLGAAVFALALAVRLFGLPSAEQSWDEDNYWSSGRNDVLNVLAGDLDPHDWQWNREHPPVTKYLAGVGALWSDGYLPARALFALLGAATCAVAFATGRRLFGEAAGLYGGVTCALLPHLVAHGRIIGHETPSVFFWTLAVYLALRAPEVAPGRAPRPPEPLGTTDLVLRLAGVGVILGLAAGTRFTNVLAAPVVGATLLIAAYRHNAGLVRTFLLGATVVPAVAVLTFVAVWPLLYHDPVGQLRGAWSILKVFHDAQDYLGVHTLTPAWHYFPVYVAATTPVLVLAAALLLGPVRAVLRRELAWLIMLVWLVLPFGVAWSPIRQDGVRYVLPVLVPLALAAGAGLAWVVDRWPRLSWPAGAVLALYLVVSLWRIHPYYLDYYAEPVGGPARVADKRLFQIGWWGEGLGAAVAYLNEHAAPNAAVARLASPNHVTWLRHDLWGRLSDQVRPDTEWLLVNDQWIANRQPSFTPPAAYKLVHDVQAQGASLARVYHREGTP